MMRRLKAWPLVLAIADLLMIAIAVLFKCMPLLLWKLSMDFFEDILENFKNLNGFSNDTELEADDWLDIIEQYKACVVEEKGKAFPSDVYEQLWGAISAVFLSWHSRRGRYISPAA